MDDQILSSAAREFNYKIGIEQKFLGRSYDQIAVALRLRTALETLECAIDMEHWPTAANAWAQIDHLLRTLPPAPSSRLNTAYSQMQDAGMKTWREFLETAESDIDAGIAWLDRREAQRKQNAAINKGAHSCDRQCGEVFDIPGIWHCPKCDHHWPEHRDSCWNCYWDREASEKHGE